MLLRTIWTEVFSLTVPRQSGEIAEAGQVYCNRVAELIELRFKGSSWGQV